jgi:hypothetical protein
MCIEEGRGIYRGEREGKRLESKFTRLRRWGGLCFVSWFVALVPCLYCFIWAMGLESVPGTMDEE